MIGHGVITYTVVDPVQYDHGSDPTVRILLSRSTISELITSTCTTEGFIYSNIIYKNIRIIDTVNVIHNL